MKTLVYRIGGANSSGCRGMSVDSETNSFRRFWGGCDGMERLNGVVDEKHIRI